MKGEDIAVSQSYKMFDDRDFAAANTLLELANAVVPMQTASKSSEISKRGTGKLKFRLPLLSKATCAKRNKKKGGHKDNFSRVAEIDMENDTDKPTSVKKQFPSEKAKAGAGSLDGRKARDDEHSVRVVNSSIGDISFEGHQLSKGKNSIKYIWEVPHQIEDRVVKPEGL